jgi:hypothetical protein
MLITYFCGIVAAIFKKETGSNFLMSGINSGRWNRTMLNLCGIVTAILKMAIGRNFSMSGINSTGCHLQNGHHNSAQIRYCPISTKISYLGRLWCPELIPDIEKFLISDNVEFLPPIFMPCFGSHFENGRHFENFETQNCSSNGDLSLCQMLCLYHYPVRSYQH